LKFQFKPASVDNFVYNDLHIIEAIYDDPKILLKLLSFLRKQSDQVSKIYFPTTDDNFHFVPFDPRNGSDNIIARLYHEIHNQGIGLMYRLIDIPAFFRKTANYSFNDIDLRLKIEVNDSFCKAVDGAYVVYFKNGKPSVRKATSSFDVKIELDVSDLSSLVMGSVDFRSLYKYGLAEISDAKYADLVNRLFYSYDKPACRTFF